jgi:dolichol-phosphate mannosyltransferase
MPNAITLAREEDKMEIIVDRVLIVIPTFKEYENLKVIIPELFIQVPGTHVLIVDDMSHDGTAHLMHEFQATFGKKIHFISRLNNPSYAKSLLEGIMFGIQNGYTTIIQMDADGSHAPKDIPRMLKINGDVIIGSRYLRNSNVRGVPWKRQMYSILGNVYISILWRSLLRDKTNGLRLFRASALEILSNFNGSSLGFAVQIQTLNMLRKDKKIQIVEIPIEFVYRQIGDSKFDLKKLFEAMIATTSRR